MVETWFSKARWLEWRRLWRWAKVGLTGLCLVVVGMIVYYERKVLAQHIQAVDLTLLLEALGWYMADLAIYVIAWASILSKLEGQIGFLDHVRIFCLSNAVKRLPGTLWYIGGRVVLYRKAGVAARSVLVASGVEAVLIWLSGMLVAIPIFITSRLNLLGLWAGVGVALLILLTALNPRTLRWIVAHTTREKAFTPVGLRDVCLWLTLYVIGWLAGGLLLFSVIGMFQPLSLGRLPAVVGIWALSGVLSMLTMALPSSLGVMEITLTTLLSTIVPRGLAVLVALSVRGLTTVLDLLWGGFAALLQKALTLD